MTPPLKTEGKRAGWRKLYDSALVWAFDINECLADIETLLAANKVLEDENALLHAAGGKTARSRRRIMRMHNYSEDKALTAIRRQYEIARQENGRLQAALKRAGEVTDERVEVVGLAVFKAMSWLPGAGAFEDVGFWQDQARSIARAALTAALAIQPKGDGEPAGQDGWTPIATAPKSTKVLVMKGPHVDVAYQTDHQCEIKDTWRHGGSHERGRQLDYWPTHWRLLPAPPDTGAR